MKDIPFNPSETNNKIALFLFGLPGSGKTSIAQRLSQLSGFYILSGGKLFRGFLDSKFDSEEKRIAEEIVLKGIGAPNHLMIQLFRRELENHNADKIVFDGNPKDFNQFKEILKLLEDFNFQEGQVFYIWLDSEASVISERIKKRLICSVCGRLHNENRRDCLICGGTIIRRKDDESKKAIDSKMKWFENEVKTIIFYCESKHNFLKVSPDSIIEEILHTVVEWLKVASI
jgi:adenylate kinase family enzyme